MPWQKGQSGNPAGKQKSDARVLLEKAIRRAERDLSKQTGKSMRFWDHVVKQALVDNTVLVAVLRQLLPDLKSVEGKLDPGDAMRELLLWLAGRGDSNGNGAHHDPAGN